MIYGPQKHRRRSIRLPGYDYSLPGAYFVTACIRKGEPLLGKITNGVMAMNPFGQVVRQTWDQLPNHYGHIRLDCFAVMPNHVPGIIFVVDTNTGGAGLKPVPTDKATDRHAISEIIRGFKTFSARRRNQLRRTPGQSVWQRNYFEHVVRDESARNRIREYILRNPSNWARDRENPYRQGRDDFDQWLAQQGKGGFETRPYGNCGPCRK